MNAFKKGRIVVKLGSSSVTSSVSSKGGGNSVKKSNTTSTAANPPPVAESSSSTAMAQNQQPPPAATGSTLEEQLQASKDLVAQEKAGKRKLFHSLVKLADELRTNKAELAALKKEKEGGGDDLASKWYEGGMWRAPTVLPGAGRRASAVPTTSSSGSGPANNALSSLGAQAVSLSDLFFNLVIVTAFTRVGVAVSQQGTLSTSSILYFAMFWTVWGKEASYTTRFDTTDLSAQMETLVTCFAVLFASLSVQQAINSPDGTRIMVMAAFVACLHCLLHVRVYVAISNESKASADEQQQQHQRQERDALAAHVTKYAVFNIIMTALEASVWIIGIVFVPEDSNLRWCVFLVGLLCSLRVPRAFLASDFHAACSQRGVLFILLLGFLLQQILVVASEFFAYQTPNVQHYAFLGAACLMLFCIKLLYVDDSDTTLAADHAMLVNRTAAFFFHMGQFALLGSTTVMGSGLNLLTHDYLAATAALPGPAKQLVSGGFSATLLSTFFIKSMHLRRIPVQGKHRTFFIVAYVFQTLVMLTVVAITAYMCFGFYDASSGLLAYLMQSNIELLFFLSGAALLCVVMSWLDEGVELLLYKSAQDATAFRVHPFGFWWCWRATADFSHQDLREQHAATDNPEEWKRLGSTTRLSVLSPLLGESYTDLQQQQQLSDYQAVAKADV